MKIRDIAISILLAATLSLSVVFVSCSENGGISIGPSDPSDPTYVGLGDGVNLEGYLAEFFLQVGKGASKDLGGSMEGWVLSAVGLSGASSDYSKELAKIADELDSIVVLLNGISNELTEIEQTLLEINCSEQQSSLQTEIGRLENLFDQYNAMVLTVQGGDTIPTSIMQD